MFIKFLVINNINFYPTITSEQLNERELVLSNTHILAISLLTKLIFWNNIIIWGDKKISCKTGWEEHGRPSGQDRKAIWIWDNSNWPTKCTLSSFFEKEKSSEKLKKQSQKRFRNYLKVENPGRILPQDQNLPFVNHGNGTSN